MKPVAKAGLVAGGYLVAFGIACAVIALYEAATSGPDRQTYAAMYEFGDSLLFLAAFGLAAILPTATGLFFLRPCPKFWVVLSVVALALAATCIAAGLGFAAIRMTPVNPSALPAWSAVAVLRLLIAPLFALAFFLSGLFAPNRRSRIALLAATGIEATVFAGYLLALLNPFQFH